MGDSITTESSTMSSLEHKVPEVNTCDSVSQNCSESVKSHDSESNLIGTSEDSSDTATTSPSPPQTPMTWAKGKEDFGEFKNEGSENNGFYQTNLTIPEKDVKDLFKQPYNDLLVPVNQSKKGLRSGKLYVTKQLGSEKGCCRKYLCWILLGILLLTGITLGILAIAGVFDGASNVDQPEELKGDTHLHIDTNKLSEDDLIIKPKVDEEIVDQPENRDGANLFDGVENELPKLEPEPADGDQNVPAPGSDDSGSDDSVKDSQFNQDPALSPEDPDQTPRHGQVPSEDTPVQSAPEQAPEPSSPETPSDEINIDVVSVDIVQKGESETQPEEVPKVDEPTNVDEARPVDIDVVEVIEDGPVAIDNKTVLVPEPVGPVSEPEITFGQILETPGPHVSDILDAEFRITDLEFSPALENQSSTEYQKLANEIETELRRLLIPQSLIDAKEYDFRVGVIQFKSGSVICHFRIGWLLLPGVLVAPLPYTPESLRDTLATSLTTNNGLFLNYVVPVESVVVYRVTDVCVTTPSFCGSLICGFSHDQISFACTCPVGYVLSADNQFCLPVPQEDIPWTPVGAVAPESFNTTDGAFEEVFLVPTKSEVNSTTPVVEEGFVPIVSSVDEVNEVVKNETEEVDSVLVDGIKDVAENVTEKVDTFVSLVDEIKEELDALKNVTEDLGIEPRIPETRDEVTSSEKPIVTEVDDQADKVAAEEIEEVTEVSVSDDIAANGIIASEVIPELPQNASSTEPPQEVEYEYESEAEPEILIDPVDVVKAGEEPKEVESIPSEVEKQVEVFNSEVNPETDLTNKSEVLGQDLDKEETEVVDEKQEEPKVAEVEKPADLAAVGEIEKPAVVDELQVVNITADQQSNRTDSTNDQSATTSSPVNQFDLIGKQAGNVTEEDVEYVEYDEQIENADELGLELMEKDDESNGQLDETTLLKRVIQSGPSEQLIPVTDKPSIEFLSEPCGNWPLDLESSVFSSRLGASLVEWPSLARLFFVQARKSCTAVIVDKDWVLAAYSCMKKSDPDVDSKKWVLFAGGPSARGRAAPNTQIRTVEEIVVHPEAEKDTDSGNMVLVKINQPLTFSESLRAICVTSHAVEERQACTVVGWQQGAGRGDVTFSQYSKFLTSTKVNTTNCNIDEGSDKSNSICSEVIEDDGICLTDEGAPMMCVGRGGFWELGGVYTRSSMCSLDKSNLIFASVSGGSPFQWVKDTIRR